MPRVKVFALMLGGADALVVRLQDVTQILRSLIQFLPNMLAIGVLVALCSRGLEAWARRRFRVQAQQLVKP